MLNLILGIAGTGKTTALYNYMQQRTSQQLPCVLLVPEQFSSSAERMVFETFGEGKNGLVEVLSFRTLAQRILKQQGGISQKIISDAARVVFVRRALDALGGQLKIFGRHRQSTAFCAMCAHTISELKTAGASSNILRQAAKHSGDGKMAELALLLDAYNATLQNLAQDPEDRLLLAAKLVPHSTFCGKAVFIDDFDGFTSPEYLLVGQLIACCPDVTVALCCDDISETDGGLGLFSPVRKTAAHLMQNAAKSGVKSKILQKLPFVHRGAPCGLAGVNMLFAFKDAAGANAGSTTLTHYPDEWQEATAVCAKMRSLAVAGVPYNKMAVVCRDMAAYLAPMRRGFGLYGIPFFCDTNDTIEYTAAVGFVRAALKLLAGGIGTEALLALLKTDLCGFAEEDIFALENYAFTWGPKAAAWRGGFAQNPEGLLNKFTASGEKELAHLNTLRAKIMQPVEAFVKNAKDKNVAEVSRQVYLLLQAFNAPENADAACLRLAQGGEQALAAAGRRAWDVCMGLLDEIVLLLGEKPCPPLNMRICFCCLCAQPSLAKHHNPLNVQPLPGQTACACII